MKTFIEEHAVMIIIVSAAVIAALIPFAIYIYSKSNKLKKEFEYKKAPL